MAEQVPEANQDFLSAYSKNLLELGNVLLKTATNSLDETDPDTKKVRETTAWPWQKVAGIIAAAVAGVFVVGWLLKKS